VAEISPVIDYTSRDFAGMKQSLLDYAKIAFPDWVPASEGDFGVLLIELQSYMADVLSYYVDRAQMEAYISSATQRASILNHAQLLGYVPSSGVPAVGTVTFQTPETTESAQPSPPVVIPAGTRVSTAMVAEIDAQIIFETDEVIEVPGEGGTEEVGVTEGETVKDETTKGPIKIGESNGLPDQFFRLARPNVYDHTVRLYVEGEEWTEITHLLDATRDEKRFETVLDDQGYTWVRFGDSVNGAIPNIGLSVSVNYRVGYGARGNIASGLVVNIFDSTVSGVDLQRVNDAAGNRSTSSTMVGGADPESNEQIRVNAPRAMHTQQRAVTVQDYENFAIAVPGVTKANAEAEHVTSVMVWIIGPDGGNPPAVLIDRVKTALAGRSLIGVDVTVGGPNFVGINIGSVATPATVEAWPTYSRSAVKFNVEQAIKNFLGFQQAEMGQLITASDLYKVIMAVEGVRYCDLTIMARADAAQTGVANIALQPWEMPTVGTLNISVSGGLG